ncbi:hypothetical protein GCM10028801_28310 [Nocardioides maradonensis]
MNDASDPWWARQLTEIPTLTDVRRQVEHIVAGKYQGWSAADQADLVSLVVEKYLDKFGKNTDAWKRGSGGEREIPTGWLRTIVTSSAIDLFRKDQARPAVPVDFGDAETDADWDLRAALKDLATPSLVTARGVAADRALSALSERDRQLIRLRVIEDLDLKEVARHTGASYEATKRAVQRAVARLRKVVESDPDLREDLQDRPGYPQA